MHLYLVIFQFHVLVNSESVRIRWRWPKYITKMSDNTNYSPYIECQFTHPMSRGQRGINQANMTKPQCWHISVLTNTQGASSAFICLFYLHSLCFSFYSCLSISTKLWQNYQSVQMFDTQLNHILFVMRSEIHPLSWVLLDWYWWFELCFLHTASQWYVLHFLLSLEETTGLVCSENNEWVSGRMREVDLASVMFSYQDFEHYTNACDMWRRPVFDYCIHESRLLCHLAELYTTCAELFSDLPHVLDLCWLLPAT